MEITDVYKRLHKLTTREEYYKKRNSQLSADYYDRLKKTEINGKEAYIFDDLDLIPTGQSFNIVKHTRFVPVPLHVHNFIELNYVYSGSCTQVIDGNTVKLTKGQICLVDTDVPHSIDNTGVDDIIINILVKKDYFLRQISQDNYNGGIVFDFVLNALSESQSHNQYIVFENSQDNKIRLIINQIITEHLEPGIGSDKIIENLISILFTMLVRIFNYQTNKQTSKSHSDVLLILQYIDQNYQKLSLDDIAHHFNYNSSYVSTLIKKATGRTFSQLLINLRLDRAESLIRNSNSSIRECAENSGFNNISFFYKKYQEKYHRLPSASKE
ncbi:AraC family transcriptional regulator [Companilactobacillus sp. FL22-1]|uniref:AraC family transcriptional regulator n=1 Tax=Companilactobacillus sp. FL22-1 TaxID=3373892 RepID=UPI0037541285